MTNLKKRCLAYALALLLILAVPVSAQAASRGVYYRPSLTFVTRKAPEDMMMYMELTHQGERYNVFLYREDRLWESYFRFYHQTATEIPNWYGSRAEFRDAVLVVETGGVETRVPLPEEARRTAETALAHIAANRLDELFGMMANQDSTVFEGRYVSGILAGNDFAPATIGDEVRRLERSTVPHLIVRVHSVPRKRDYWLTLLNRNGKYLIGAISPVGKAL